jgi:hypothetical protein
MNISETITILDALASGCSPVTGEQFPEESVLNTREVIRALQISINELKRLEPPSNPATEVRIEEADLNEVFELFTLQGKNPTVNRFTGFF